MTDQYNSNPKKGRIFPGLSIQQRLPLYMAALLLTMVLTFGLLSYYTVRNSTLKIGRDRLRSVTDQIASMLSQSVQNSMNATRTHMRRDTIRQFVVNGDLEMQPEVEDIMERLLRDSTRLAVEILDASGKRILYTAKPGMDGITARGASLQFPPGYKDSVFFGNMFVMHDSIFYPSIGRISSNKVVVGYIVNWRLLRSSQKNLDQVLSLMGSGATLYIGNTDGSTWTDLIRPVDHAPFDTSGIKGIYEYENAGSQKVLAAAQPVENTSWIVLTEFSESAITETATRFLKWVFLLGLLVIILGILVAWLISRNITRPLRNLTEAASAVSAKNYDLTVSIERQDEIGQLAMAFNTMKDRVKMSEAELEKKVEERTAALEKVNKELEAFTYSVSHDLRSPLRAIIGFTSILEEDYGSKLDDEAKRITGVISSNVSKMGMLIDDLLAFSRLGKQSINKSNIDSAAMVNEVIAQFNSTSAANSIQVNHLPNIFGDPNTIRQVWINLLSNAIKYSGKVIQPLIEIGSFDQNGFTVFYVKDNGAGFDQQYSHKLFKVFQRLHSVTEFEGTGVGLAIVDKIVSKHGGMVWAEGHVNKGATFYFSIPNATETT